MEASNRSELVNKVYLKVMDGWEDVPDSMPAQDVTLKGFYVINKDLKYNLVHCTEGHIIADELAKENADFASKLGKVLSLDDGQENPEILDKINYLLDIIPSFDLSIKPRSDKASLVFECRL